MRALFLTFNDIRSQSARYRGFWPAQALREAGEETRCLVWREARRADLEWARVTIFVRVVNAALRAWLPRRTLHRLSGLVEAARARGPVLADLDDLVFVPGHDRGRPDLTRWHSHHLTRVTALLTTTQPLAEVLRGLAPSVTVMPNAVDLAALTCPPAAPASRVRLGWCCGVTHVDDEPVFLKIAQALSAELAGEAELLLWGRPSAALLAAIRSLPLPHRVLPMIPWTDAGSAWSQFDVNLIPLAPIPLNACKSAVHWIEPGALGVPSVASPRGEFLSVIRPGVNGFLAEGPEEWTAQVAALVRSPDLRAQIGSQARAEIVSTRTLAQQGPRLREVLAAHFEGRR